ncbi:MAG: hypothetical protein RsTaC01_0214 [Candidatus Paraimprobicoccus trichonymphae]|uniref:Uncharacterized protein n=1 Tax=Candidatus Paraimprobicoccus trichonymphae TaxID=3033793 RepID=A0AA48IBK1_9FIRM|nr:MAG: hypothetical protein RsTaC01_0214 [Candidatus Paraimprobicoccus trichonymphae]
MPMEVVYKIYQFRKNGQTVNIPKETPKYFIQLWDEEIRQIIKTKNGKAFFNKIGFEPDLNPNIDYIEVYLDNNYGNASFNDNNDDRYRSYYLNKDDLKDID